MQRRESCNPATLQSDTDQNKKGCMEMIKHASHEYLRTDRTALFRQLTRRLKEEGLFQQDPSFYMRRFAWYVVVHSAMLALIGTTHSVALAVLFTCIDGVYVLRIGFIGHDMAHGTISTSRLYKQHFADFLWAFFLGLSRDFWDKKHTLHHKFTNITSTKTGDPDIETPPFVIGEGQSQVRDVWINRLVVRNQHWLYWPTLSLLIFSLTESSFKFLLKDEYKQRKTRPRGNKPLVVALILVGWVVNNFPYFLTHDGWTAAALLLFKYLYVGFVIGLAFALNHVGLPTVGDDYRIDHFTLQTYTCRNITGAFGRWFWGVLAHQTEHHLWPGLPWPHVARAASLTRAFCAEHGMIYNEATPLAAWRDSAVSLKHLGERTEFVGEAASLH